MDSPGIPPETSNFYCLPGKAGGFPLVLRIIRRSSGWFGGSSRRKRGWISTFCRSILHWNPAREVIEQLNEGWPGLLVWQAIARPRLRRDRAAIHSRELARCHRGRVIESPSSQRRRDAENSSLHPLRLCELGDFNNPAAISLCGSTHGTKHRPTHADKRRRLGRGTPVLSVEPTDTMHADSNDRIQAFQCPKPSIPRSSPSHLPLPHSLHTDGTVTAEPMT